MADDDTLTQVIASLERTLSHIQDKLHNAHVLNGGFDRLMERIENIEDTQVKILDEVENVKKTIYDPDNGIYSRIKDGDDALEKNLHVLDKTIVEIKLNSENEAKSMSEVDETVKQSLELVKKDMKDLETLKPKVAELDKWKSAVNKIVFAVAIPITTTFGKILYDFFSAHVLLK